MITGAQLRVLEAVTEICGDGGWPTTVREVQAKLGYASPQNVHMHLVALEQAGLVETNPRWPSRRGGWRPVVRAPG